MLSSNSPVFIVSHLFQLMFNGEMIKGFRKKIHMNGSLYVNKSCCHCFVMSISVFTKCVPTSVPTQFTVALGRFHE